MSSGGTPSEQERKAKQHDQAPGGAQGDDPEGELVGDLRGTPRFFEYWNRMDAVNWMGVRIVESADGRALARFEPEKHHRGAGVGGRAVTGATQAYIFDFVTGAAVSSLSHGAAPQVTVQLECMYHYPAYDPPLTFEAHVQTAGRQIVFVEATCTDCNGRVCSRANAIYRRFERRIAPADEGSAATDRTE
jgi:acyl-coenzyme A thioesterase PaaI-like protein